jgi:hypothetical protein
MNCSPRDESFRLGLGTALKCRQDPYHRCLIVSDPPKNGGYIVLVRITTDDGKWRDRDCLLTPAEWEIWSSSRAQTLRRRRWRKERDDLSAIADRNLFSAVDPIKNRVEIVPHLADGSRPYVTQPCVTSGLRSIRE